MILSDRDIRAEIDAGRITIDGIDIRQMTLTSLRREIGIVQQDVFLFDGSVRGTGAGSRPRLRRQEQR